MSRKTRPSAGVNSPTNVGSPPDTSHTRYTDPAGGAGTPSPITYACCSPGAVISCTGPTSMRLRIRAARELCGVGEGLGPPVGIVGAHALADRDPGEPHDDRDAGGNRDHLHRTPARGLRLQLAVQAGQHRLGRRQRLGCHAQIGGQPLEVVEGLTTGAATGHVIGEQSVGLGRVGPGEAAQHVAGQQFVDRVVVVAHRRSMSVGGSSVSGSVRSSARRSLRMAARVLVFTVPIGMAISSAICTWVFPP